MTQKSRILIAVGLIVLIVSLVLGLEVLRRQRSVLTRAGDEVVLQPGSIPIYVDGSLAAGFTPEGLGELETVSFVDDEDGKTQEGWMLRDVLGLYLNTAALDSDASIMVSSSSREKSVTLTWAEVDDPVNWVMFDVSGRGTLKLVSVLERLDVRDEWVQDVDKIGVVTR